MDKELEVGTVVSLYKDIANIGELRGAVGIVYNKYFMWDNKGKERRPGYSIIFETGGHDGFSPSDCTEFLYIYGVIEFDYIFVNVTKLVSDITNPYFKKKFIQAKAIAIADVNLYDYED